jgi:hypothetical protein
VGATLSPSEGYIIRKNRLAEGQLRYLRIRRNRGAEGAGDSCEFLPTLYSRRGALLESRGMALPYKPGDKLPDLRLGTMGGSSVALHDFLGRKAVIYVWSSW